MGEAQQRASAAEGRGGGHLHSACLSTAAGPAAWWRWAEAWRGDSALLELGLRVLRDCRASCFHTGWSCWAEPRVRVLCRSAGRGGELGLGSGSCQSGPPPSPKARTEVPAAAAHRELLPCRRVLMGPEGLSADGLSRLLQQGQLCTPRGVLDAAVSRT